MRPALLAVALVLGTVSGCDVFLGLDAAKSRDAAATEADVASDVLLNPASCRAIQLATPSAPSGMYMIDPDGNSGEPALTAYCDMMTAGGGWTLVYFAPSDNLMVPIPYTTNAPVLLSTAQDALIAFRDANRGVLTGVATFAMPPDWRTGSPFNYAGSDLAVMTSIDGAAPVAGTLRYGQQDWTGVCDGAWKAGAVGRVCIVGTAAPFYAWFTTSSTVDVCTRSDIQLGQTGTPCNPNRLFSIAVR